MIQFAHSLRPRLSAAGRSWQSCWFQPQQMYALGAVRLAFGALVVLWALWLLPMRDGLLDPNGAVPMQPSIPHTWGIFAFWRSNEAILLGIIVLLLAGIALLVGWHSRVAAIVTFVMVVSFQRWDPWVFNSGDVLVRIEALFLGLSPCGTALSLDQRRRKGSFWSAQTRPNWPIRLIQVQFSLIYIAAAQVKLSGDAWLGGTAVSYVLRLKDMQRVPFPRWLATNALAMNAVTWGALAIELAVGVLVWFPRFRPWVLFAGVLLHLMVEVHIQIGIFSYAMLVMYLAWISPITVQRAPEKLKRVLRQLHAVRGTTESQLNNKAVNDRENLRGEIEPTVSTTDH